MTDDIEVRLHSVLEEMASAAPLANPEHPRRMGPPARRSGPHFDFKTLTLVGCLLVLVGTLISIGVEASHRSSSRPASTQNGSLKGRLMEDGGPAPGLPRSAEGTITVTGHGISKSLRVGSTGLFTFALPSGSYTVSASLAGNAGPCSTTPPGKVKVVAQGTSVVHVFCSIK